MKKLHTDLSIGLGVLWAIGQVYALPQVSDVRLTQLPGAREVKVTYNLSENAIVTLAIATNGVALADREVTSLSGDVNRLVTAGEGKEIIWNTGADWPERSAGGVQAGVTAWPENDPPAVMVVNLGEGANAASYPVNYYASVNALPEGGVANAIYKTHRIVMRRVRTRGAAPENGVFLMGAPAGELGRSFRETQHEVTLTNDFYVGIFGVTQGQWHKVTGSRPSGFSHPDFWESRPVERVSWLQIRMRKDAAANGTATNDALYAQANWPSGGRWVGPDSFMGLLRTKTGLNAFDLPTEAQWEYACRAGAATALNSGRDLASQTSDPGMDLLGRYKFNGGLFTSDGGSTWSTPARNATTGTNLATAIVGSYRPNEWGLYDMHGNVYEWCLDWMQDNLGTAAVTHPVGPAACVDTHTTGGVAYPGRAVRGGSLELQASNCRAAFRASWAEYKADNYSLGFRLIMNLE
jgi:formylglycine-generating enzyme required for sulfatase activity